MKPDPVSKVSIALVDTLTHTTPGELAALRRTLEQRPGMSAWLDQAAAARADAIAVVPPDRESGGDTPMDDLPGWLTLSVVEIHTRYALGKSATCPHAPRPARPQPVVAAAWRPGLVVCLPCIGRLRPAGAEKYRCDSCGRDDPGIHAGRIVYGPLMFMFGVCGDCSPDLPAHVAPGAP